MAPGATPVSGEGVVARADDPPVRRFPASMLRLTGLRLSGVAYFRGAELDLGWRGTTFITGENRNAQAAGRRNGAGKSLLLAPLAHLAFGDPTGLPKSLSRHSLLTEDGSRIEWTLEAGGSEWVLAKERRGRGIKWSAHRDGVDLKPRTASVAESMAAELVPFSEEEFHTLVYLDSRRPSPLLMGSPAARQSYLTGLLRVDEFDRLREWVRDAASAKRQLAAERDALAGTLPDDAPDPADARKSLDKVERRLGRAKRSLDRARSDLKARLLFERHRGGLAVSEGFDPDRWSALRRMEKEHAAAARARAAREAWDAARRDWAKGVRQRMSDLGWEGSGTAAASAWLEDELRSAARMVRADERLRSERASAQDRIDRLDARCHRQIDILEGIQPGADPSVLPAIIWAAKAELSDARDGRTRLDAELRRLEALGGDECPTCGGPVDQDEISARRERVAASLKRLPKLGPLESRLRGLERADAAWSSDDQEERQSALDDLSRLPEPGDRKALERRARDLRRALDLLAAKPGGAPAHGPAAPEMDADAVSAELESLDAAHRAWADVKAVRADAEKGRSLPPSEELRDAVDGWQRKALDLERKAAAAAARLRDAERMGRRRRDVEDRLAAMDAELADAPVLSRLMDAYGSKGLRQVVLKDAADRICGNMNRFAPLLFAERMEFSAEVGSGGIGLLARRSDGRVSDVRHLSGAESRLFSLVWLLGTLPLVPSSRRCNLVVLDEFEANLDRPTREMLVGEYLPALNEVVDHVIFVTPNDPPEPGHGRRVLTVVKDGESSTVKETS